MANNDTMYIANLAFFLNYDQGETTDEIELEIYKAAFQQKESIHYDRENGAGFQDLEQEPNNISVGLGFCSDLIESVYRINEEKGFEPYIVLGFDDITIDDDTAGKTGEYLVEVQYRLLQDLNTNGTVSI